MKTIEVFEKKKSLNGCITLSFECDPDSVVVGDGELYSVVDKKTILILNKYIDKEYDIFYTYTCDEDVSVITNIPKYKSLYKTYSSDATLLNSNIYDVNLEIKDKIYKKEFHTKFNPLYSSVDKIRQDTGDLLDNIPNLEIQKFIFQNSLAVLEIVGSEDDEEVEVTSQMKEYVRYKTDLDLVNSVYLTISGRYGMVRKDISSLKIEYEYKLPELDKMIQYFKAKVDELREDIAGATLAIASFTKASGTEYPISESRNSF